MRKTHVVAQGECLGAIGKRYGFADYRKIYNHADNEWFKRRRPDSNVIRPGDRIVIPDTEAKQVAAATGAVHTFIVDPPIRKIPVVFEDEQGTAFGGLSYRFGGSRSRRPGPSPAQLQAFRGPRAVHEYALE